jgi:hypothetical protein
MDTNSTMSTKKIGGAKPENERDRECARVLRRDETGLNAQYLRWYAL